jgi:hypothetical protein
VGICKKTDFLVPLGMGGFSIAKNISNDIKVVKKNRDFFAHLVFDIFLGSHYTYVWGSFTYI